MENQLDFTGTQRRCLCPEQALLGCTTNGVAKLEPVRRDGGCVVASQRHVVRTLCMNKVGAL